MEVPRYSIVIFSRKKDIDTTINKIYRSSNPAWLSKLDSGDQKYLSEVKSECLKILRKKGPKTSAAITKELPNKMLEKCKKIQKKQKTLQGSFIGYAMKWAYALGEGEKDKKKKKKRKEKMEEEEKEEKEEEKENGRKRRIKRKKKNMEEEEEEEEYG